MKVIKCNNRTDRPAYFDMACRYPPRNAKWYGKLFRMGDKAVIYAYLNLWRKSNPTRKLTLITCPNSNETSWARFLDNELLFESCVDEIVIADNTTESLPPVVGQNLYDQHLFSLWRSLRSSQPLPISYRVAAEDEAAALCRLKDWNVPKRYAVIVPLFDAKYDRHRNLPIEWWALVARNLSLKMPVVITGDGCQMGRFPAAQINNVFPLFKNNPTPVHSMALIQNAAVYIGGETGLTLWAGLMRTPVVACYRYWDPTWYKNARRGLDTRPISAGATVQWVCPPYQHDMVVNTAVSIARRS